jgi:D-alanyl-D-alanine carboxypeptidase (penicillin-binding protein 5/6)
VAGSVPRFVAMMNQEARAVGATRTHFANPDGLPNPDHVTTALDLARIAAAAIRNPTLVQVLGTKVLERYPMPSGPPQPMVNQDRLLWTFPGIVGGKIGFTDQAGNTMVAVARRHGMTLIAVVLHDVPWTYFGDVAGLLDYGFAHYHQVTLVPAGLALGRRPIAGVVGRSAPLETAGAVTWAVENGGQVAVTTHLAVPRRLPSGRPAGTPVGTLTVGVAGQGATSVPVVLARATPKPPPPARPWRLAWPDLALAAAAVAAAAAGAARRRAKSLRMHMHMRPRRRYRLRRDSVWMRLAGGSR